MLNPETIREATRLTQAGQLSEATGLLQRMLGGKLASEVKSLGRVSLPGREPSTIDAKANDVEETNRAHPARAHALPADASRYSTEQRTAPGSECEA
jgi:hypothetical protein